MKQPLIVLMTDFGVRDPFVGLMKSVIWTHAPGVPIVDLTHDITPQSVREGAFWLRTSEGWLPPHAVVVAVVDPGVGGPRRALVVESGGRVFVGPDNGLLGFAASKVSARSHAIDLTRLGLGVPSRTFHGRDVFAPVGARLATGRLAPTEVGPRVDDLVASPIPEPEVQGERVKGEIAVVDRFGNLITNIPWPLARATQGRGVLVGGEIVTFGETYSDALPGGLVALENSFGLVEIACRDASARERLALSVGAEVWVIGQDGS
jgi:S-adenosyl-L-methionine hydrolase (adenosine-forming)